MAVPENSSLQAAKHAVTAATSPVRPEYRQLPRKKASGRLTGSGAVRQRRCIRTVQDAPDLPDGDAGTGRFWRAAMTASEEPLAAARAAAGPQVPPGAPVLPRAEAVPFLPLVASVDAAAGSSRHQ